MDVVFLLYYRFLVRIGGNVIFMSRVELIEELCHNNRNNHICKYKVRCCPNWKD